MRGLHVFYRRLASEGPQGVAARLVYGALLPLSLIYREILRLRAVLYRRGFLSRYRASVPVISIGNLAVGGTGKTPVTDFLIKFFLTRERRVAVVSRGYGGRKQGGVLVVCRGNGPVLEPGHCGDEPYLLARRNPQALVLVAPRRADGVRRAVEELGAEIVLLDDGFQHMAVERDLDIVLLDARRPFGNGYTLPAGLLREPMSALKRGDLFILTRCQPQDQTSLPVEGPVLHSRHQLSDHATDLQGIVLPLKSLVGKKGVAFAGIAEPGEFFRSLKEKGLILTAERVFPDHCAYGEETNRQLAALCRDADYLVTTEKDAVKLSGLDWIRPLYQVPLILEFQEAEDLEGFLAPFIPVREGMP